MKRLMAWLFLLVSCTNNSSLDKVVKDDSLAGQEIPKNPDFSENNIADTFPNWLTEIYNKNDTLQNWPRHQEVEAFAIVNDSVSYCIIVINDGVCSNRQLLTLVNRQKRQEIELSQECDGDESYGSYSWSEFSRKGLKDFEITTYIETVADSLLDNNGWIRNGIKKSRSELDTKNDTVRSWLTINDAGNIMEKKD